MCSIINLLKKWMKRERPKDDAQSSCFGFGWKLCELTFDNCKNVNAESVEEVCGELLKKDIIAADEASFGDESAEKKIVRYSVDCLTTNRRLQIHFHYDVSCQLRRWTVE